MGTTKEQKKFNGIVEAVSRDKKSVKVGEFWFNNKFAEEGVICVKGDNVEVTYTASPRADGGEFKNWVYVKKVDDIKPASEKKEGYMMSYADEMKMRGFREAYAKDICIALIEKSKDKIIDYRSLAKGSVEIMKIIADGVENMNKPKPIDLDEVPEETKKKVAYKMGKNDKTSKDVLLEIINASEPNGISADALIGAVENTSDLEANINSLLEEGVIYEPKPKKYRYLA